MQKFNFDYDKKNDSLFLYNSKSKSSGSVELGDLVLDYNSKKKLVGIEISKASNIISDFIENSTKSEIRQILANLTKCKLEIKSHNGLIIIKIFLASKSKEIVPVISAPNLMETSPALAYT